MTFRAVLFDIDGTLRSASYRQVSNEVLLGAYPVALYHDGPAPLPELAYRMTSFAR